METYSELPEDEVIALAAAGDHDAMTEFVVRRRAWLSTRAGQIAGSTMDPDDLLSDVLVPLMARWMEGSGPTEAVPTYLVSSMRNRVIDEWRSPRARVSPLSDSYDAGLADDPTLHRIELHREFALVRSALRRLPDDQRTVLWATVVDGQKPQDLQVTLGRRSSAISALKWRAVRSLRRSLLQEVLEDDAPATCLEHLEGLPQSPLPDDPDKAEGTGVEHARTCPRCRAAWLSFGRLGAALTAVCIVLGLTHATAGTPTAMADDTAPPEDRVERDRGDSSRSRVRQRLSIGVGAAAIAVGAFLCVPLVTPSAAPLSHATSAPATVAVIATRSIGTKTGFRIRVDLTMRNTTSWRITAYELTTPPGSRLVRAPSGWSCQQSGNVTTCDVATPNAAGGDFDYEREPGSKDGRYDLRITARADGESVDVNATGPVLR
jgi:RNA polymerase sigma factor (sigma-70 family)